MSTNPIKEAVYLIDGFHLQKGYPSSGWDFDGRGMDRYGLGLNSPYALIVDEKIKKCVWFYRDLRLFSDCLAGGDLNFYITHGEGFCIEFLSDEDEVVFGLMQKDGFFFVNGEKTSCPAPYHERIYAEYLLDLEKKEVIVYIDGRNAGGAFPLSGSSISKVRIGYHDGSVGGSGINNIHFHINYLINDRVETAIDGRPIDVWKGFGDFKREFYHEGYAPEAGYRPNVFHTYVLETPGGRASGAKRNFKKSSGKIAYELKYLTRTSEENFTLKLTSGDDTAITVLDSGTKSYLTDGTVLRNHHPYVWQTLRIIADTDTQKAVIYHNGKCCGEHPFDKECSYLDGISLEYASEKGCLLRFVDVFVWKVNPEPEDYCPEPVMPKKKDYNVGMLICSLWRNGQHSGWGRISAYDKPVLGFYDEGLPEVADWEIKYMAEHGVDVGYYCWFASQIRAPICRTYLSDALINGHFYAKYSDKVKIGILYESGNGIHPINADTFKKYIVPFWIDYFFTDDRYYKIGNKPVLTIFGLGRFIKDMGSAEVANQCFDFLRSEIKKLGFDDIIIMSSDSSDSTEKTNIDGYYAYNWGREGYTAQSNIQNNTSKRSIFSKHMCPTLSVGFNKVPWDDVRSPMMSAEDMKKTFEWIKNDYLPSLNYDKDDWRGKTVMLSTWNEYGEGTYISPTENNGFMYLSEIRRAFTDETELFTPTLPTEKQKERLSYLFPRNKRDIHAHILKEDKNAFPQNVIHRIDFKDKDCLKDWTILQGVENLRIENSKLCGTSTMGDPQLKTTLNMNVDNITHIRFKCEEFYKELAQFGYMNTGVTIHLYFNKDEYDDFGLSLSGNPNSIPYRGICNGGYVYFDMRNCKEWCGKVKELRVDPANARLDFRIESIEFMAISVTSSTEPDVYIDSIKYNAHYPPRLIDGKWQILWDGPKGFSLYSRTKHTWDYATKTLSITDIHENTLTVTFGSGKYTINGTEYALPEPIEEYDGLCYLPVSLLEKAFGFKTRYTDDAIYIDIV